MESQKHINLVKIIYNYILGLVNEKNHCLIETDSSGQNSNIRVVNNFVPDVYYSFNNMMIIGEAKTELDFERKHSRQQYDAYIRECTFFQGESILIIGVPWQITASAKNYFRRKKNRDGINFKIVIIDELGRSYEL